MGRRRVPADAISLMGHLSGAALLMKMPISVQVVAIANAESWPRPHAMNELPCAAHASATADDDARATDDAISPTIVAGILIYTAA